LFEMHRDYPLFLDAKRHAAASLRLRGSG
jgi:hypothetical protein